MAIFWHLMDPSAIPVEHDPSCYHANLSLSRISSHLVKLLAEQIVQRLDFRCSHPSSVAWQSVLLKDTGSTFNNKKSDNNKSTPSISSSSLASNMNDLTRKVMS